MSSVFVALMMLGAVTQALNRGFVLSARPRSRSKLFSSWTPGNVVNNKPQIHVSGGSQADPKIEANVPSTLPEVREVKNDKGKDKDEDEDENSKEEVRVGQVLNMPWVGQVIATPPPATAVTAPSNNVESSSSESITTTDIGTLSNKAFSVLPCGDALDKRIFSIFIPAVLNYVLIPLTGAVDCFWVGRMRDALALAGQSGANQMFASAFFLSSFLPAVVSPLVASARSNTEVQDRTHQAMSIALIVGSLASLVLLSAPLQVLSTVLPSGSPALEFALPYLKIRSITLIPALLSTVAFAVFRGSLDIVTPLRISLVSNMVNVILDPIFIFTLGMGVPGAAAATCIADLVSFFLYTKAMLQRKLFDVKRFRSTLPTYRQLLPLLKGGVSIQVRALAIEYAFLAVSRATQTDVTGYKGAAHAVTVQLWQLGSVVLLAMSTAGSTLVPVEVVRIKQSAEEGCEPYDLTYARRVANRVMAWGTLMGVLLGVFQLWALPIVGAFTSIPEVQRAARVPVMISALLQIINGFTFTGEGIQQANLFFGHLAFTTTLASAAMLLFLRRFGQTLTGVWCALVVLYSCRMLAVFGHHWYLGPLAPRNLRIKGRQQNKASVTIE